jgi:small-conductance mechanosensitive channel
MKVARIAARRSAPGFLFSLWFLCGLLGASALAQEPSTADPTGVTQAQVIVDGKKLFRVRGTSSYPASRRAREVRQRIIDLASDETFDTERLTVSNEDPNRSVILAGDQEILNVFDEDAALESVQRELLAVVHRDVIAEAIRQYRSDRSIERLVNHSLLALTATLLFVFLLWANTRLFRWLVDWTERDVRRGVQELATKAYHLFHPHQLWAVVAGLLRFLRLVAYFVLTYFYLNAVLGLYPWTRPVARMLFRFVVNPLESIWLGFLSSLPNLIFLVILWILTSYLLKFLRAFFRAIERGRIRSESFEADWAMPTYKIVRILVVAFAVVVAYPYIPGSDSLAFKGVTVFVGILLSLGSSSFIANLLAGLSMTYRGAFRVGDRIRVGETEGTVEELKVMITRVRTPKNEIVIIPNSSIMNTDVVNYSQLAKSEGLLLHTKVGIGYDTPWRRVEAMLIEAAGRTNGVDTERKPFVLQTSLGDFSVQYQINAYCKEVRNLPHIYSELHANIQDVFNENGVQIMSPAYVADPETPKLVPPELRETP